MIATSITIIAIITIIPNILVILGMIAQCYESTITNR